MRHGRASRAARTAIAALAAALGVCGCLSGGEVPPVQGPTLGGPTLSRGPSAVAIAQRTHEYPSGPFARQRVDGTAPSAVVAVWAFATVYINWNAHTLAGQLRLLAAGSIGQARSAMALAAAEVPRDYELKRGGIANRGIVEAATRLDGTRNQWIVVTREQTTATASNAYQGLAPSWHVTVATVAEVYPGGWVVSAWQPES